LQIKSKIFFRSFTVVIFVVILAYVLGWSSIFSVESIAIHGTKQVALVESQLLTSGSKLVIGKPMARINPATEEKIISGLEWIESVKIARDWLNRKIEVTVKERTPVAVFTPPAGVDSGNIEPRYLAGDGIEFSSPEIYENLATISLGNKSLSQRRQAAIFVANLPADILKTLINLQIRKSGAILMYSDFRQGGLKINWGAGNSAMDVTIKGRILKGLLALPENKKITEVDLTITASPIVR